MKRNLLALVAVLVLVAVASRLQHDPQRTGLENDLKASLESLWGTHGHRAEVVDAKGGLVARLSVDMPKTGSLEWNEPFLRFVAARHPHLPLAGLEVTPSSPHQGQTQEPRIELLRRQTQSLVDGALGPGQALVLLAGIDSNEAQSLAPQQMEERAPVQQAVPDQGAPRMKREYSPEASPVVAPLRVLEECLVVLPEVPDNRLKVVQAQIQAEAPCQQFRVVRLPSL
jgi:hypothetical protein